MTDLNIERLPVVNGFPTVRDECHHAKIRCREGSIVFGAGVESALSLTPYMAFFAASSVIRAVSLTDGC